MQLSVDNYYAIQDISEARGTQKPLTVVAEYDNEAEARQARAGLKVRGCEVYAEVGGRVYRVICPKTTISSDAKDAQ
jgi:hypothetical protein